MFDLILGAFGNTRNCQVGGVLQERARPTLPQATSQVKLEP